MTTPELSMQLANMTSGCSSCKRTEATVVDAIFTEPVWYQPRSLWKAISSMALASQLPPLPAFSKGDRLALRGSLNATPTAVLAVT
jgi:hypothetical protein